ncbi:MAG: heparinase II/III family protein [Pirellulales bacterium]|nr:heparinase II/III family protein [Pirellulales bacterium]
MWRAQSQNVILVNGESFTSNRNAAVGRITHFRTSDAVDVVAGEAGDAYPALNRWARRIVFIKPNIFLIHDVLEAKEPATFQFLLHAPGMFALSPPDCGSFKAPHGQVDFQFLHPVGLRITQTDEYEPPPASWSNLDLSEWHLKASTTAKIQRQHFLTMFQVNGRKAMTDWARIENSFQISLKPEDSDTTYRVKLDDQRFEVSGGSIDWHFTD